MKEKSDSNESLKKKLGGSHTTIVGDRLGKKVLKTISLNSEIKKIIPSFIKVKGKGVSGGSLNCKIMRADDRGNLRLLISQGTTTQEIRLVTTAGDKKAGERIRNNINQALLIDK
ncbi:DUF2103 domain-containing protein [Methanosalsum natronophilum]|uniref:Metal-binding protein n=1 Tax=Methanosalsum natronophilum TaxID=768733 RepID=A0A424YXZ6_9EURY|nr:DUF2103 domain-containing protein [Methanosalsum natronophilum]MCS3924630.1 hypothetical protein [Methanosalsum natronophilum]RQD85402.1 MAG: metal-binding protein [Methanosalsum natronophilum]